MGNFFSRKRQRDTLGTGMTRMMPDSVASEYPDNVYYENEEQNDNRYIVKEIPNTEPNGKVLIYGFLKKKSKYLGLWKTRFFILTNHYFFAFTGVEDDADCTMALNVLNINSVEQVKNTKNGGNIESEEENKIENEKETKNHIFALRCNNNSYFFKAENKNILDIWISNISIVIKSNKHQYALTPKNK